MTPRSSSFKNAGFSLIEILAVLAIIAILGSMTVFSLKGTAAAQKLHASVELTWSLASKARAVSVSSQKAVALVFTESKTPQGDATRAFILMSYDSGKWQPVTPWNKLADSVEVVPSAAQNTGKIGFYNSDDSATISAYGEIAAALPNLGDLGVGQFSYIVYRPDGSVDANSENPGLLFRRLNAQRDTAESALLVAPETGRVRIVQL